MREDLVEAIAKLKDVPGIVELVVEVRTQTGAAFRSDPQPLSWASLHAKAMA